MSQAYTIELATKSHVRAIPGIEQAAATLFSEHDLPPELRYLITDKETLDEAQRQDRLWVALDDKRNPVGFALTRIVGSFAHLEELDVHPDHGRQGIGSRLLCAVTEWGRVRRAPCDAPDRRPREPRSPVSGDPAQRGLPRLRPVCRATSHGGGGQEVSGPVPPRPRRRSRHRPVEARHLHESLGRVSARSGALPPARGRGHHSGIR